MSTPDSSTVCFKFDDADVSVGDWLLSFGKDYISFPRDCVTVFKNDWSLGREEGVGGVQWEKREDWGGCRALIQGVPLGLGEFLGRRRRRWSGKRGLSSRQPRLAYYIRHRFFLISKDNTSVRFEDISFWWAAAVQWLSEGEGEGGKVRGIPLICSTGSGEASGEHRGFKAGEAIRGF